MIVIGIILVIIFVPFSTGVTYLGCVLDSSSPRTLPNDLLTSSSMTPETCINHCSSLGYLYAGTETADECYCGDDGFSFDYKNERDCRSKCTGDTSLKCGGSLRLSLNQLFSIEYNFEGCIVDDMNARVLPFEYLPKPDIMTIAICIHHCWWRNYPYAGLEYAYECFCGIDPTVFVYADVGECTTPCAGAAEEICGANNRLSTYFIAGMDTPQNTQPPLTSSTDVMNSNPVTSLQDPTEPGSPTYLGCVLDSSAPRTLPFDLFTSTVMTHDLCIEHCSSLGYLYAGTEAANQCYCGNDGSNFDYKNERDCRSKCTGDTSLACGGNLRLSAYQLFSIVHVFEGCVIDDMNARVMPLDLLSKPDVMTIDICIHHCWKLGHTYAGLEFAYECFCGVDSSGFVYVDRSECSTPCAGAPEEICGADNRLSTYLISGMNLYVNQLPDVTSPDISATTVVVSTLQEQQTTRESIITSQFLSTSSQQLTTESTHQQTTLQSPTEPTIITTQTSTSKQTTGSTRSERTTPQTTLETVTSQPTTETAGPVSTISPPTTETTRFETTMRQPTTKTIRPEHTTSQQTIETTMSETSTLHLTTEMIDSQTSTLQSTTGTTDSQTSTLQQTAKANDSQPSTQELTAGTNNSQTSKLQSTITTDSQTSKVQTAKTTDSQTSTVQQTKETTDSQTSTVQQTKETTDSQTSLLQSTTEILVQLKTGATQSQLSTADQTTETPKTQTTAIQPTAQTIASTFDSTNHTQATTANGMGEQSTKSNLTNETPSNYNTSTSSATSTKILSSRPITSTRGMEFFTVLPSTPAPNQNNTCTCPCKYDNITITELVEKATRGLLVDKKTTNSYIYSKKCMQDSRPSSKVIGAFGVVLTSIPFVLIVTIDILNFIGVG